LALSPRRAGQLSINRRFSPATRVVSLPVHEFLQRQGIGAIVLFVAAAVALIWANSRWGGLYHDLSHAYFDVTVGPIRVHHSILHWINDGLMTIFFFLVGMEIKYEVLHGHLSTVKKAALPAIAALGGMIVPAALYLWINFGETTAHGWGIPMATDIAFAVGVLALLPSISDELRVFLLALAIVDDIGAILVIAVFYSEGVQLTPLFIALGLLVVIVIAQWALPQFGMFQVLLAFFFWTAVLASGVHATIAGVILAFTVSSKSRFDIGQFDEEASGILQELKGAVHEGDKSRSDLLLGELETLTIHTDAPIDRVTRNVLPWVTLVILPLFALANAGVMITADSILAGLRSHILWGIGAGLLIGKPLGISLFSWLAVKLRIAEFPSGTTIRQLVGLGTLGGIGFTVAIFIANLAFNDPAELEAAKVSILVASSLAGILGYTLLRFGNKPAPAPRADATHS
jgi:NhaA family Na+:H+ antiporter